MRRLEKSPIESNPARKPTPENSPSASPEIPRLTVEGWRQLLEKFYAGDKYGAVSHALQNIATSLGFPDEVVKLMSHFSWTEAQALLRSGDAQEFETLLASQEIFPPDQVPVFLEALRTANFEDPVAAATVKADAPSPERPRDEFVDDGLQAARAGRKEFREFLVSRGVPEKNSAALAKAWRSLEERDLRPLLGGLKNRLEREAVSPPAGSQQEKVRWSAAQILGSVFKSIIAFAIWDKDPDGARKNEKISLYIQRLSERASPTVGALGMLGVPLAPDIPEFLLPDDAYYSTIEAGQAAAKHMAQVDAAQAQTQEAAAQGVEPRAPLNVPRSGKFSAPNVFIDPSGTIHYRGVGGKIIGVAPVDTSDVLLRPRSEKPPESESADPALQLQEAVDKALVQDRQALVQHLAADPALGLTDAQAEETVNTLAGVGVSNLTRLVNDTPFDPSNLPRGWDPNRAPLGQIKARLTRLNQDLNILFADRAQLRNRAREIESEHGTKWLEEALDETEGEIEMKMEERETLKELEKEIEKKLGFRDFGEGGAQPSQFQETGHNLLDSIMAAVGNWLGDPEKVLTTVVVAAIIAFALAALKSRRTTT